VISATFSLEFRQFKETMLQFALMLLSANALTCNNWSMAAGQRVDADASECGPGMDKCISYSFTVTVANVGSTVTNSGMCGSVAMCDTVKSTGEQTGTVSDFKCGTCDTDKCNTEATADGGNAGGNTPAATDKKNGTMKMETDALRWSRRKIVAKKNLL